MSQYFPILAICIAIIFPVGIGILAIGLILCFAKIKAGQRSKMRDVILREHAPSFGDAAWLPIRYSSHHHFSKVWKFFAWETSGIMFLDKQSVSFFAENEIDHSLVFDLSAPETSLNWVGMKWWPNGFVYWFSIVSDGKTHYFTSETGTFVITSRKTTENLYNRLRECVDKVDRT